MRVALFSDIHSNFLALQQVLEDIRKQAVDRLICLGDIVGYNDQPVECVQAVRESGADVVMGNHDFTPPIKRNWIGSIRWHGRVWNIPGNI
ncbi:MAG: metallophosphoesterase [Blastochloris sp.]|nr:metallophosphoesterase [Blastochloris sp.]